jgi:hypothetical protein
MFLEIPPQIIEKTKYKFWIKDLKRGEGKNN